MTSSTGSAAPSTMTEEDKQNFARLDEGSKGLRAAAYDMAVLINNLPDPQKTPELNLVAMALAKISAGDIQDMDLAFNNLKKATAGMMLRNDSDLPFGKTISGEDLNVMLAAYHRVLQESIDLTKKAQELAAGAP